jgi:hypothetical protein
LLGSSAHSLYYLKLVLSVSASKVLCALVFVLWVRRDQARSIRGSKITTTTTTTTTNTSPSSDADFDLETSTLLVPHWILILQFLLPNEQEQEFSHQETCTIYQEPSKESTIPPKMLLRNTTVVVALSLWLLVVLLLPSQHNATIISSSKPYGTFDQDSREDCRSLLQYCQSDLYGHIYVQCAKSCTDYLQATADGGDMVGTIDDKDAMYQLPPLRLYNSYQTTSTPSTTTNNNKLNMERFEGSVTLVAVVPLISGMAAYHYELLLHVHETFAPHLECIIIPIDHGHGIHIKGKKQQQQQRGSRSSSAMVWVAEEESALHTVPLIQHLLSVKPRNGSGTQDPQGNVVQVELPYDRVTVYIISADSLFVERLVSPTLATLKSKIHVYLKTIDYEL